MTSDLEPGRAYPYRTGWWTIGCGVMLFGTLGAGAVALISHGWEQLRAGKMPIGVAMMVSGAFGAPLLLMGVFSILVGVRNVFRPPLLRVTPTALLLPKTLRGGAERLDEGDPKPDHGLPQPAEVPFAAIRWVRREGSVNPGSHKLVIVHDLAPATLVIEQYMMRAGDFDELESALRAAVPGAFAPAPCLHP